MNAAKFLIISMRRTGGTLLGNLLDGHPDCSVFPFEHWHTRRKSVYDARRHKLFSWMTPGMKFRHCGPKRMWKKKFVLAHGSDRWPEFYADLLEQARGANSPAEFYDRTAELYFGRYHPGGLGPIVVNHSAHLCTLPPEQLRDIFGEARYIMTLRDPRATFASTERGIQKKAERKGRDKPDFDPRRLERFCNDWRWSTENYYLEPNRAICMRFEDLVREPRKTMEQLATAMEISFQETLLSPERLGNSMNANSSFSRKPGIDPAAADSWREHLDPTWKQMIEDRLGDIMEQVGYTLD